MTSSSRIEPPWASSKRPVRSASAPVKAPRLWPKSSLSVSCAERTGQLRLTSGPVGAAAQRMDRLGDEFLAGAAFAADQHGFVGRRDLGDAAAQLLHRAAAADHPRGVGGVGDRIRVGCSTW